MSEDSKEVLVEVENLAKSYGAIRAVADVSFALRRGDVLGFLGPNGAGKTTAMKMITGFLRPDTGRVRLAGFDVQKDPVSAQRRLGYLPESAPAYGEMTPMSFLGFVAEARALERPGDAIELAIRRTGLDGVRQQTIETLSKGFKRRVGLAQALLHDPDVLILDEPTDGLDPNQKVLVHDLIVELAEADKAIILSTHILDEAEKVCNRAIVISQGRILADSTPSELRREVAELDLRLSIDRAVSDELLASVRSRDWVASAEALGERDIALATTDAGLDVSDLVSTLAPANLVDLQPRGGRLETAFRHLTGGIAQ